MVNDDYPVDVPVTRQSPDALWTASGRSSVR
jgi:hypothetical protein